MIVDLNSQTFSLKNKKKSFKTKLVRLMIIAMTAALILTGAVPSFASERKASADIDWSDAPEISSSAAIMIDGTTGDILYEKNAKELREPASITKMLTCLVVIENMDLNQKVTIKDELSQSGGSIKLKVGEQITVKELLYAAMLPSANDAAEALAIAAGGDVKTFCRMMNKRAKEIGALNTNFTNPSGLNGPGQEKHLTTAYDLALIGKEAMKNPTFRKLAATRKHTIPPTNKSDERVISNTNTCLGLYKGTTGIKTGRTSTAGFCFIGAAKRGATELIVVNLNAPKEELRFTEAIKLWDYGFSKYYTHIVAKKGKELDDIKVKRGSLRSVKVGPEETLAVTLNKGFDSKNIRAEIKINSGEIKVPAKKGTVVGTATAYNRDNQPLATVPLVTLEQVNEGGLLSYIGIADEDRWLFALGLLLLIVLIIVIVWRIRIIKRRKYERRRAQRQRTIRRREWEREKNPFGNE